MEIGVFIITAAITLLIAFIAISFQAVRAATANPVKSLRYE
jgi:putative ABC transport system permease protein